MSAEDDQAAHDGAQFLAKLDEIARQPEGTTAQRRNVHIEDESSVRKCNICKKRFYSSEIVLLHKDNYHTEASRRKCNECPMVFISVAGSNNHYGSGVHSYCLSPGKTVHTCRWCGCQIVAKSHFEDHLDHCRKRRAALDELNMMDPGRSDLSRV